MSAIEQQTRIVPANPRHSSAKEDWGTPPWIAEASRRVLGTIDLDPASSAAANEIIKAREFFIQETNGLDRPWLPMEQHGPVSSFTNPPGGLIPGVGSSVKAWWQKLLEEWPQQYFGHGLFLSFSIEAVQVTQVECSSSLLDFPTCFFKRRVGFYDSVLRKIVNGNTHSSCITYVPGQFDNTELFREVFSEFGRVTQPLG